MKLTAVQREILQALIDLYYMKKGAVQGKNIAEKLDRHPGTIRNQMVALRALGLVEGVSGPRGGYYPNSEAFTALDFDDLKEEATVPISRGDKKVENLNVVGIELKSISDPKKCKAAIHVKGPLKSLNIGDLITVGPTPVQKLVIKGRIFGRDDIDNILVMDIMEMLGIPKIKIKDLTTSKIKTLTPDMDVKKAARMISEGRFRGAPVINGKKIVGMVSTVDITAAVSMNKEQGKVEDIMSTKITKINQNAPLADAIELTEKNNVSRLIVVNNDDELMGMVTRTDILSRLGALSRHYFKE